MTYRLTAKFYDLFGSKNDLDFYRNLACQTGKKALELGVGTGRVAIALAKAGITVVGIDTSVHMLRVARKKLTREAATVREHVTFKQGDMRHFKLQQSFPLVYIPASTFDHNVTIDEQRQTLNCIYRHLEPNGIFAFDLEQIKLEDPKTSWWIDRKAINDEKLIVRSIFTRKDLKNRCCNLDLFFDVYDYGELVKRYHEYGEVAIITKEGITELLEATGFSVENIYGDFDLSKYQKDSSKIILVARKKGD